MGRHRRRTDDDGSTDTETREVIEKRLGMNDVVCTACATTNPTTADVCRSCGHTSFRPKADEYRGKGSENSGR